MAIIIGVVLAIAISLSSARIQTINGDLNEGVKKTENRFCWTYEAYGSYYNLNAAISACKADANCGYIYDVDCDNYGSFQLCKLNAETQKSGQGSCIYKISKQKVAKSCTCKDLISKWGYGNCQGTLDSSRGNVAVCYVNQPSSCGDLVDSSTNPGEKSSAEPCSQALSKQGAEKACNEFGNGWSVNVVRDGSVVCTLNSLNWGKNCNKCDTWRLVVWKDGAHERKPGYGGYNGIQISTKAGRYYGGHDPCEIGDNLPVCGEWSTHPGSGYENPEVSSGLKELSTQLLTSTRAPTLQTTENIQSTQGNTPGHQSSHCRDQKIWCNLADCSLANVKRNCQKTCNLC